MSLPSSALPAGFIAPCPPTSAPRPPSGELWLYEIKHDGFRVIARKDSDRVRLYSRPGNDLTKRFPLIVESLGRLRPRSCIIDGEAVVRRQEAAEPRRGATSFSITPGSNGRRTTMTAMFFLAPRREDYERFLAIMVDRDELPQTFEEWEREIGPKVADLKVRGVVLNPVTWPRCSCIWRWPPLRDDLWDAVRRDLVG